MEAKLAAITLIAVVIAVSGCSALPIPNSGGQTSSPEPKMVSGKGLEVTQFKVSDNTVTPDQKVELTLKLKNYHTEPISIGQINLYNLGLFQKVGSKECIPSEIDPAKKQGVYPVMKCTWTIKAPSADTIGGFEQRKTTVGASIPYDSLIKNFQAMKVNFQPLSEVNRTGKKVMTFSNGEVKVKMQTETPVPRGQKKLIKFTVREVGSGRVKEPSNGEAYEFEYSPQAVFQTSPESGVKDKYVCPSADTPIIENKLEFSCYIGVSDGPQPVVRNLFFTASYKYVRAPSVDITIVS